MSADSPPETPKRLGSALVSNAPHALSDELYEDRFLICLALRLEGYTVEEIQEKTGLTLRQVQYACMKARRAGKLRDVIDVIENDAVPQAVENLRTALNNPEHEHWWDATTETLHGRGVFRRFNTQKTDGGGGDALPNLQIAIINPGGGAELPTVIVNSQVGSVVGVAREDDDDA